jgi:hypothetical protein
MTERSEQNGVIVDSGSSAGSTDVGSRLDVANRVLATFSQSRIERRRGGWYVLWENTRQGPMAKRWHCRGQDFYPSWHRHWPGGGTACTALSQLIRWLRDQPVLPISSWRYWASETCKLLPATVADALLEAGYPKHVPCVLCGDTIVGGLDWWSLDGVSGPCCDLASECRQKPSP